MQWDPAALLSRLDALEQHLHSTQSRITDLENTVVTLRSDNYSLLKFKTTALSTFVHAETLIVDMAGRLEVLGKEQNGQYIEKLSKRLDKLDDPWEGRMPNLEQVVERADDNAQFGSASAKKQDGRAVCRSQ